MHTDPLLNMNIGKDSDRALMRLWLLRALVHLRVYLNFINHGECSDPIWATALGLEAIIVSESDKRDPRRIQAAFRDALSAAEREAAINFENVCISGPMAVNCNALQTLLQLSPTESRILEFAVLSRYSWGLLNITRYLDAISIDDAIHAIGVILNVPAEDVRQAFAPKSPLVQCSILKLGSDEEYCALLERFNFPTEDFSYRIVTREQDILELLGNVITRCEPPQLTLNNFDHLGDVLVVANAYLNHAFFAAQAGVNVLLWGPPGTGKTQLARILARSHDNCALEVTVQTTAGVPLLGPARLKAYQAAQALSRQPRTVIIFEEAEDIFGDWSDADSSGVRSRKAWFNRALETNAVPTIWTVNSIQGLDPAFVRRFDLIIELPIPPLATREAILREHCGKLLTPDALHQLARCNALAPAVVARAASVIGSTNDVLSADARAEQLERQLMATLQAQGVSLRNTLLRESNTEFNPAFVNVDCDLIALMERVREGASVRLLLDGPPGSGKSACASWLAESAQRSIEALRVSDIVSPWVGQTERNLARAFQRARRERTVLIIDEIDSFLRDRRQARHSWEQTAVNELLAQIDDFEGMLIGTTNFASVLDDAALRRFDLRVQFSFLSDQQRWLLFMQLCEHWGLPVIEGLVIQDTLSRCHQLTPGDFATIKRRHRLMPFTSVMDLSDAISEESTRKTMTNKSPIGFIH